MDNHVECCAAQTTVGEEIIKLQCSMLSRLLRQMRLQQQCHFEILESSHIRCGLLLLYAGQNQKKVCRK